AGDNDAREAFAGKRPDRERRIISQSEMIEPWSEVFGAATVALIEEGDVKAGAVRLVRDAAHVVSGAGSFESVQRDEGWMRAAVRLPVAVREHLRIFGDGEQLLFRDRQIQAPWRRPAVQRHPVPPRP